ncbi:ATP-binding protein [Desulfococcaceae bacterium HSG8]|nr:ATP-binding protein [Desulfococcaceae bacterium HSG8]
MIFSDNEFYQKLKWLTFFRVVFTTLLLSSTIVLQLGQAASPLSKPLLSLYGIIACIFVLSFCYTIVLKFFLVPGSKSRLTFPLFAYIQVSVDTFLVTVIIFMTGSFSSVFVFLYLVVIIYASMLLFRRGSMIMAAFCSIQYGLMVDLEFYGALKPFGMENLIIVDYTVNHVLYKIIIMMIACFAVAFLSSLLAEQERKTKKALLVMEDHVKRVEKMAAIGEMAAGLAHEIKNPIASLRGSIQLLREEANYNPEQDKLMNIALREADRLNSLVSDFLLFAKPPVGRLEVFDLGSTLTETLMLFERDATCYGKISVTKEIVPGILIEMDPVHLHQVFWNLLLNAAESIDNGGSIHVEMFPVKDKYVAIRVTDTGSGMSSEIIKTIFDPFITTKSRGTGLGLSIVHRIIESYDGRIEVESEIGVGTTFTLKIKRVISNNKSQIPSTKSQINPKSQYPI